MQAAIGTRSRTHYVTAFYHQLMHTKTKDRTLRKIGKFVSQFDIVCLQELDLGGRRSAYSSQLDKLAKITGHPHVAGQENRKVRNISRHGNAILTRLPLVECHDLKLPGRIAGRGAMIATLDAGHPLTVVNAHLSLGVNDQIQQLDYIADHLPKTGAVIFAGDLNIQAESPTLNNFVKRTRLNCFTNQTHKTYPAWRPRKALDHILGTSEVFVEDISVKTEKLSDHLAVCMKFSSR